ncbi:Glycosyl_transferase family 2 protein [Hexamita inflata]|uniref:Glycosyl transferase family 2 protein n=1 Tax=Hexamita inflata TaxID=28002 RepID=A0AA86R8M3_9EUKA|nr:Glycosyl transferase family 2 protein [Hexamita inflata]
MSQLPLISLILPCYNQAANLRQSIPFLLNQSFKNFEIVCVNDGSTDDTKAVIQHFQQLDARVRLVEQNTNRGTLSTRLLGALNANGAYITQFDPDDRLSTNFVLQNLSESLSLQEPDILHFKMRLVFDPPNFKIEPYHWANPRKLQIEPGNLMSSFELVDTYQINKQALQTFTRTIINTIKLFYFYFSFEKPALLTPEVNEICVLRQRCKQYLKQVILKHEQVLRVELQLNTNMIQIALVLNLLLHLLRSDDTQKSYEHLYEYMQQYYISTRLIIINILQLHFRLIQSKFKQHCQ